MMRTPIQLPISLVMLLTVTTLAACDRDEPIDDGRARQALESNITSMTTHMVTTIKPFEQSSLYGVEGDSLRGHTTCEPVFDTDGNYIDEECQNVPGPSLDEEMAEVRTQLLDALNTYILVESNIEDSSRREVTYLLRGSTLCQDQQQSNASGYTQCVQQVDQAQIRLVVTSPEEGDLDVDIFLGANKQFNPLKLYIWQQSLGVEVDLAGLKGAVGFVAGIVGEEPPELPSTFQGRSSWTLAKTGTRAMELRAAITQAIQIADVEDGYDIKLATANPAFKIGADGAALQMISAIGMGAIQLKFPTTQSEWDDFGHEIQGATHIVDLRMGGLTANVVVDVNTKEVAVTGAGLGATSTTLDIDAKRVLTVDLNAAAGRSFDATFSENANGDVQVAFSPSVDLKAVLAFAQLGSALDDLGVDDWMRVDDTLRVALTGTNPTLLLGTAIKVLSGSLELSSTARSQTITVGAAQCLIDDNPGFSSSEPCYYDDATMDYICPEPSDEEDDYDSHPLAYLSAGTCE